MILRPDKKAKGGSKAVRGPEESAAARAYEREPR